MYMFKIRKLNKKFLYLSDNVICHPQLYGVSVQACWDQQVAKKAGRAYRQVSSPCSGGETQELMELLRLNLCKYLWTICFIC